MPRLRRWDPCVEHRGAEVEVFISDYFNAGERNVLFVAGAGFDPRSTAIGTVLGEAGAQVRALFIQEVRPNPTGSLMQRANANATRLTAVFSDHEVASVEIFGSDNAVVGGRNVVAALHRQSFEGVTDVVVDLSALSVGTSFPIVRYLVERAERGLGPINIHIFVAHDPQLDEAIQPIASDSPGFVHGFGGGWALDATLLHGWAGWPGQGGVGERLPS